MVYIVVFKKSANQEKFVDPVGFDDIPVELFYGVCEDLGRNNYVKYKAQFEVNFDLNFSF